jgi:hypothetical protein
MKKVLLGTIAMAAMLAVPAISLADTYQYVTTAGTLGTITAATPDEAIFNAPNIAPHSGVIDETVTSGITTTTEPVTITTTTPVTTTTPTTTTNTTGDTTSNTDNGDLTAAGTYISSPASATSTVMTSNIASSTLTLSQNGTATLITAYTNGSGTMTETGTWTQTGSNGVQLTLNGNGTTNYNPAHMISFTMSGNTLSASSYNTSTYGSAGLTLTRENS